MELSCGAAGIVRASLGVVCRYAFVGTPPGAGSLPQGGSVDAAFMFTGD